MKASSAGNEAKGGKQSGTTTGAPGSLKAGVQDAKTGGAEGKYGRRSINGKTDQALTTLEENSKGKREDERKNSGMFGRLRGGGSGYGKKNPTEGLQEIVYRREKEIKEIELKLSAAADGGEKAALGVQLKGAQHALKEALVSMSLVQRKEEVLGSKLKNGGDETMNEEEQQGRDSDTEINRVVEDMEVEGKIVEMTIQDTEMDLYTDNYEERSDDDGGSDNTEEEKKQRKKHKKEKLDDVIDLTMTNEKDTHTIRWEDMSDDDTVHQANMEDNTNEWQIATNKKYKKTKESNNKKQENNKKENEQHLGAQTITTSALKITNPYKHKTNHGPYERSKNTVQKSSLASYAEATTGKQRASNSMAIRVTTSFTPRLSGTGEFKRVAKELLGYAKEVVPEAMLLPWNDQSGLGPIQEDDLANPKNYMDTIKHYFNKPPYVTMQPGTPAYGIGVRFSVNCDKYEFLNKWNMKKREYKLKNRAAYTIALAPMQTSPTAFIIGLAVGSSENQDVELLNKCLEAATGIKGVEISYQNIHQAGITPELWKMANDKAKKVSVDTTSREYLKEKYSWAPNGLAVYVPKKEMVNVAGKIMLKLYGKTVEGMDPVWPDGSSMRFLPIKGAAIKSEKTKDVVKK